MILVLIIFALFNLMLLLNMVYAWREVWGLLGGFGKGVWEEGGGGYLQRAREARSNWTAGFIFFTALHVGVYFEQGYL